MTTEDKLLKLKKLADAMYYATQYLTTDASRLHKAMDEYHQFIINEYHKEEPVNEDLAKAAQIYAASLVLNGAVSDLTVKQLREVADKCFKAGAEWMANQGVTVEGYLIQDIEEGNGDFLCSLEYIPYNSEFNKDGEKIIAQIRKKE